MVVKVIKYVTEDGQWFDTEEEAELQELTQYLYNEANLDWTNCLVAAGAILKKYNITEKE